MPSAADEIASERTEYARTYRLSSGGRRTLISTAPVNYRDEQGDWQPIDTHLVASGADALATADSPVEVSAPRDLADGPVKVTDDDDRWVAFALDGAQAQASVAGSTVSYKDAVGSTDAAMTATPLGVKETLTLEDADAPTSYRYALTASSGLTASKHADGSVALVDSQGTTRFVIPAPTVEEDGGEPTTDHVSYGLSPDGAQLTVTVDPAWLAQAQFPVKVDPSVTKLVTSCTLASGTSSATSSCNGTSLQLGKSSASGPVSRIAMRVSSLGGIPQTASIVDAALGLRLQAQTSTGATPDIDVRQLTRTITTQATWNSFQTGSAWTTAGGDTTGAFDRSQIRTGWVGSSTDFAYFDISPIVEQWVRGDSNRGLLMQMRDETITNQLTFAGSGATSGNVPFIVIDWVRHPGRETDKTYESQTIDSHSDLAVDVAGGNASASSTDLTIAGAGGFDLKFGRTYNATDDLSRRRALADHWSLSINGASLSLERNYPNDSRVLRAGDGGVYRFDRNPTSDTSGHLAYRTPSNITATMDTNTTTGKTTVTFPTGVVWTYNQYFPGELESISDGQGHLYSTFQSTVATNDTEPTQIRNSAGTTVATLSYNSSGALTAISDTSSHTWHYGQTSGSGAWMLNTVTDPASNVTHYYYNSGGQLTKITDAANHDTTLAYGDGSNGDPSQLTQVVSGTPAVTTSFDYLPATAGGHACDATVANAPYGDNITVGRTVEWASASRVTTYCYNKAGQVIQTWRPWDTVTPAVTRSGGTAAQYVAGTAPISIAAAATDGSSGVQRLAIEEVGHGELTAVTVVCPASAQMPRLCPGSATSTPTITQAQLPEGSHDLRVVATDLAGNVGYSATWTVVVDHAAPTITLAGAAVDNASNLDGGGWSLDANTTDGTTTAAQSGVASVAYHVVSGPTDEDDLQAQDQCTTTVNCPLNADFTVDADVLVAGSHTIQVTAVDRAGNTATTTLTVTTSSDPDLVAGGGLAARGVAPNLFSTPQELVCPGGPEYEVYYGGSTVAGLDVSWAQRTCSPPDQTLGRHSTLYSYGACAAPEGSTSCELPLTISSSPQCERHAKLYTDADGDRLAYEDRTAKDVPTAVYGDGRLIEVYSGHTTITINAATPAIASAALTAIRPTPSANQPLFHALQGLPEDDPDPVGARALDAPDDASVLNTTTPC